MYNQKVIDNTKNYIKKTFEGESSGHDYWHIFRVWKNSIAICKEENADQYVVELASLLHDIADWKFHDGDEEIGPKKAREWLESQNVGEDTINQVCEIIKEVSFKGSGVKSKMKTLEGKIVQDADRLDAMGAIGIARTFAYGGYKGREIYNPNINPETHNNSEQYKKSEGPTINHFYEKLLLLKDLMNTSSGKNIARKRHEYMEEFLNRFYQEWDGKI